MVGFPQKRPPRPQRNADGEIPEAVTSALDASAVDLRDGRIVDFDSFIDEMDAELEAHLAEKRGTAR